MQTFDHPFDTALSGCISYENWSLTSAEIDQSPLVSVCVAV